MRQLQQRRRRRVRQSVLLREVDLDALHPTGTAPIITDGDLVLGESGAIIDYIIARHGGGRLTVTADKSNFADYLFWFHFANASMLPRAMVVMILKMAGTGEGGDPRVAAMAARADLRALLREVIEAFDGACILVTHDPVDALTLADRVAIVNHGRIEQDGSPEALLRSDGIYRKLIEAEIGRLANAHTQAA